MAIVTGSGLMGCVAFRRKQGALEGYSSARRPIDDKLCTPIIGFAGVRFVLRHRCEDHNMMSLASRGTIVAACLKIIRKYSRNLDI